MQRGYTGKHNEKMTFVKNRGFLAGIEFDRPLGMK